MADGGPWLMSSGGGCTLVLEADAIWKTTMEDERGIHHSSPVVSVAKYRPFSIISRN